MSLSNEMRLLSLQRLVNDEFEAAGIEWKTSVSFVDSNDDALLERRAHHSEGTAPRTMTIRDAWAGKMPSSHAHDCVGQWIRNLHHLIRRDAAVAGAGLDVTDPPEWAFLVQHMAAIIMRNEGRDPLDLVRLDPARGDRTGWRTRALPTASETDKPGYEFDGLATGMMASLNRRRPEWHYSDKGMAGPVIGMDIRLPETVAQGLRQRLLDEVVDDPRLRGSGLRIEKVHIQPTGAVVLILERAWTALAEAPPGIDTSWLLPRKAGVAVPTI